MSSEIAELTGSNPASGTLDEAEEWIGRTGDTYYATQPVNRSMIQFFASMVEDPNPTYWDETYAEDQWGGICSPIGLLLTWGMDRVWSPHPERTDATDVSVVDVPLPGGKDSILNTRTETTVHEPLHEGTWLNWQNEILDVTEEKETHLGPGHFITSQTSYRDQKGTLLAVDTNSLLRYSDDGDESTDKNDEPYAEGRRIIDTDENNGPENPYATVEPSTITAGDTVPSFAFPVTYKKVIHNVAATRDFYPVHHDPEFARSVGNETIFLNTMAFQGLIDRLALQWAGPGWRVEERTISMRGSALAGDLLTIEGEVENIDAEQPRCEIDVSVTKDGEDICPSSVTITRNHSERGQS